MRRAGFVLAALAISASLVACRGILGVEDLGLDASATDGDGSTKDGALADGAASDATSLDSGIALDTGLLGDANPADTCRGAGGSRLSCLQCCRNAYRMPQSKLDEYARMSGCICGGGACTTECATSICMGLGDGGGGQMPPKACIDCVDNNYATMMNQACGNAYMTCQGDTQCSSAAACASGCPQ